MVLTPTHSANIEKIGAAEFILDLLRTPRSICAHVALRRHNTSPHAAAVVFYDLNSNTIVNPSYPLFRLHPVYIVIFLFAAATM